MKLEQGNAAGVRSAFGRKCVVKRFANPRVYDLFAVQWQPMPQVVGKQPHVVQPKQVIGMLVRVQHRVGQSQVLRAAVGCADP